MARTRWILSLVLALGACSADGDGGRPGRDGGTLPGSDGGTTPVLPPDCSPGTPADCGGAREAMLRGLDSDRDGLNDYEEICQYSTNPCGIDSDGDGVTDLGEVRGSMTDPLDPSSTIPDGDFFVVLPFNGPDRPIRTLSFGTSINRADVYFLIDTTGSMGTPIANVTSSLTTIAAALSERIPDVQMGVGQFRDFPFSDGDLFGDESYGSAGDMAYENMQNITGDVSAVQSALGRLSAGGGNDGPESHVAALFHASLTMGASYRYMGDTWNLPPANCPAIPDDPAPRIGYPCFRAGALPIYVMVTDVEMHDGPSNANPYTNISPRPPVFDQAMAAVTSIGARFVGVAVDGGGRAHMEEVARRTGTVDMAGAPLVQDAAGGAVSNSIIDAIGTLVGGVVQDVSTRLDNVPGNPDDTDATRFIKRVTPLEGYREGIPGAGYASKDDRTFYQVIPGTRVEFEVEFYNDFRNPPSDVAEIHRARIIVLGNGVAELDAREVYIIVSGGIVLI
ncbi:MAG: VWA domain-containing protein [Sandaracinus sp.]|nr:VWA domain-containing protein [Sandaracinus sp.]